MNKRKISICQQTWALLCKNVCKKWRMKKESLMEWLCSLLLLLFLYLYPIGHEVDDLSSLPTMDLQRVDSINLSDFAIAYAPVTNATQQIMNKVASASFVNDKEVFGLSDEDSIEEFDNNYYGLVVRVIFSSTFSYHLKFTLRHGVPTRKEHEDHTAPCFASYEDVHCQVTEFWKNGIVTLQAAINAAIIEVTTNHSVMEELMSVTGKNMKIHPYVSQDGLLVDFYIFFCIISFSPFVYSASLNVTRERKRMKGLMTMMGLQNAAFWLSWGLLYVGFIFITSLFLALIVKSDQFLLRAGFMVVFTHFFLYGLSLIALAFLMSVLVKKSFRTGLVVFLLTVFWGCLGFTVLYRHLPASLEWLLGCFSPFAFTLGIIQLLRVDYDLNSNALPDSSDYSNQIIATNFMLAFDIFLYLALTIYFEKVLPNEHEHQLSPLFFLKSSFWSRQHNAGHVALDDAVCCDPSSVDSFEPVSPEFHGKEAIRIRNVTKEYKGKPDKIKALKDLTFDIYEGQITAILGHSGAGKSTLLNILSGLSVPTKGLVTMYNNKLSEMADLENISKLTGICPQFKVQFDFLTVRENLRLFAKIKGIQPQGVEEEIQRVLMELEMKNIQNVLAQNLSGGQKRKLTIGITILGDPQVLLLDEPTAGLDPFSRHQVWNLLKGRKMDHVILFSTQFMDEADILAGWLSSYICPFDKLVMIQTGPKTLTSKHFHVSPRTLNHLITQGHDVPGNPLLLKQESVSFQREAEVCRLIPISKEEMGDWISLKLNEMCVQEKITSLVTEHIPDAKLSAESEGKLVYTLPLERTNRFPELYEKLDLHSDLGIETYGVSMTTLNEVFLKLEGESTTDEPDIAALGEVQAEGAGDTERLVEMEHVPSSLSEMRETVGGMALWRQQILAIARVRFLKLKHERKTLLTLLWILGIAMIPLLWEFILAKLYTRSYTWELTPHLYFLAPGQQPHDPLTQLLIINKTGANIDDFVRSVEHQNIVLKVDVSGTGNGLDDPSYNGAIIVSGHEKNYRFSLACNVKRLNCFPVLMHIVSNGLLKMVQPSARIQTDRTTFQGELTHSLGFLLPSLLWLLLLSCCPPYIAMTSIDDYKSRAWSQLRISGLFPSAYWLGQALVDVPLYWLMLFFMCLMDFILVFQRHIFSSFDQIIQIPCATGYGMSLIFFTYIVSFICRKGRKNSGIWSLCFFIITNFCVFITMIGLLGPHTMYITVFLVPQSTLLICIFIFWNLLMSSMFHEESGGIKPFLVFLIPLLHFIIFLFILRCLEWKFGKISMSKDPFFRISPRSSNVCPNPEDPGAEDEDVQMERVRTTNALNSTNFDEKPVIIASCLRKEYVGKKKHCFSKTKKKTATRNVSFCVRKGEVLGLLGHNGAGKSTSIRMITGDSKPTAGQVLLKGSHEGDTPKFLGYCPQEDALWPNLTVRQHLEVFAAVRGLRKADAKVAITRLVEALKLQDQQKQPVKALSQGIKRKLCFALSMLGSPSVVLLDEPSTGMDPEGQQQMWQAIRTIVKNTERGVLLTTHYMAEAEAVCDRVAIMVSGRLRCIGSIQHLKSKFGKDYLLEMKVKSPTQVEPLHSEILRLFPQAARQERYSSLMVYKLPVEDVRPLAQAFFKLERVKQNFDLEEYSLSQSTLEQVFLELSKEQELENFDEELHPSVRQKLLLQEEP